MGEDGSTGKKNPIDIKGLPDSVTTLCDAMMKMDPNWSLLEWLDRRAMEELELVASHLGREKMRLEQRLSRVDDIARQMGRQNEANSLSRRDPFQRNLFDVYDGVKKTEQPTVAEMLESAANDAPPITDDDPMLSIISLRILEMIEQANADGCEFITLDDILNELIPSNLQEEEVEEAIAHLVQRGEIIEFKYGQFCLNRS